MHDIIRLYQYLTQKYLKHFLEEAPDSYVSEYVRSRDLTPELIERFGLGYSGFESLAAMRALTKCSEDDLVNAGLAKHTKYGLYDRFQNRLLFPIKDVWGDLVGFGGRDVSGKAKAKYVNSPSSDLFYKTELLYNVHRVQPGSSEATIMEGYFDVIRMEERGGFVNPVAVMGTALTHEQIKLLMRLGVKRVRLAMDSDWAGLVATARCVSMLEEYPDMGYDIAYLDDHKDWDEALLEGLPKFSVMTFLDAHWLVEQLDQKLPLDMHKTQRVQVSNAIYEHVNHSQRLMMQVADLLELEPHKMRRAYAHKRKGMGYFLQRGYPDAK